MTYTQHPAYRAPRPARPPRAYPRHLTRYPAALALVFVPGRRHRGPSLFASVRHPVAAAIVFMILLCWAAVPLAWILAVTIGWGYWVAAVTAWWLVTLPFRPRQLHR